MCHCGATKKYAHFDGEKGLLKREKKRNNENVHDKIIVHIQEKNVPRLTVVCRVKTMDSS